MGRDGACLLWAHTWPPPHLYPFPHCLGERAGIAVSAVSPSMWLRVAGRIALVHCHVGMAPVMLAMMETLRHRRGPGPRQGTGSPSDFGELSRAAACLSPSERGQSPGLGRPQKGDSPHGQAGSFSPDAACETQPSWRTTKQEKPDERIPASGRQDGKGQLVSLVRPSPGEGSRC